MAGADGAGATAARCGGTRWAARGLAVLVLACVAGLVSVPGAPSAAADGGSAGGDVVVAQTLGERELTVALRRPGAGPGPVAVDVVTHAGSPPGRVRSAVLRPGAPMAPGAGVSVPLRVGSVPALVQVPGRGRWELAVSDGRDVARIPFAVPAPVVAGWERAVYGGFAAAGVGLLVALVLACSRRPRARRLAPVGAGVVVAGASVAVTAALLSASIPPPPPPAATPPAGSPAMPAMPGMPGMGSTPAPTGMPGMAGPGPVSMTVAARPGVEETTVELGLREVTTGAPVDDLVPVDDAFLHLAVVGAGDRLRHVHPVRTAPGRFLVHLPGLEPGRYGVAAEIARPGGGTRLLRSAFTVPGAAPPSSPLPGPGVRQVAGMTAEVTAHGLVAGSASRIVLRFRSPSGPVTDLQPWLGMLGHLLISGPPISEPVDPADPARLFAHAHAMTPGPVTSPGGSRPDETVAAYGPEVGFSYTFPRPGRYRVWAQVERDFGIVTVPVALDVAPAAGQP